MAVFRKIVSSLVVVSYVKMQILTAFAMEQPAHFKIQVERRLDVQDQLEGLILKLSQKKQDEDAYELVQTDFLISSSEIFLTLLWREMKARTFLRRKSESFQRMFSLVRSIKRSLNGRLLL